ncbi:hypothetical protein M0802_003768 [Mischocyttarus mexicanus]|nr:hypothetical protein M0802_003768 [Mischocyttarus mexicanus]
MSLLLRANFRHKCQTLLQDGKSLGCSYLLMNHNRNFKRAVHSDQKISERQPMVIYRGTLKNKLLILKILSLTTSATALALQPHLLMKAIAVDSVTGIAGSICFGVASVFTTLFFHVVTRNYATIMHYDSKRDKYIATTYTIFLRENKMEFTPNDVVVPEITGIFTTCLIKGKPMLFDYHFFDDPHHYNKIMGLDKPIDYKLSNTNLNNITTEENLSEKTENKR